MRPTFLFAFTFLFAPAAAGCSADLEPAPVDTAESAQTSSNCGFIPGCKELLEASDGPFSASVMTYEDASGTERRRLSITYREPPSSSFLLCSLFPRQPDADLVFVVGEADARRSVRRAMTVSCPTSYGDNLGQSNTASFGILQDEEPELWDTLFPPHADGSRWYALRLAAANAHGAWDSRFGDDYRLVLHPR